MRNIILGNTKSLWQAVKNRKDQCINELPKKMHLNNSEIKNEELPDKFADFFENKIKTIVNVTQINKEVYNGQRKMFHNSNDYNIMTQSDIRNAIMNIKVNKTGLFFP